MLMDLVEGSIPDRDGPSDECGVFGVYAPVRDPARLAYFALYALQHRGQESAGIRPGIGHNGPWVHTLPTGSGADPTGGRYPEWVAMNPVTSSQAAALWAPNSAALRSKKLCGAPG